MQPQNKRAKSRVSRIGRKITSPRSNRSVVSVDSDVIRDSLFVLLHEKEASITAITGLTRDPEALRREQQSRNVWQHQHLGPRANR